MGAKISRLLRWKSSSLDTISYAPSSSWNSPTRTPSRASFSDILIQAHVKSKLRRRYSHIADNYTSLDQVTEALSQAGLESSNLIVGIDFTKSNEWTGAKSFNHQCLHHIGEMPNPYEQAISIIGETLSAFDEDNMIPCFGFGDVSTHDKHVFSFYPNEKPCNGFSEVLERYRDLVPHVSLAGPTSFGPIIATATRIVEESGGQYHVLLIIADGQVTRSIDTANGHLSPQELNTIDAIVEASKYPLSIVLVGVGDGPWDMMHRFDDNIPARDFDNFQFVNFTKIMSQNAAVSRKQTEFSLTALMEIPTQYKATLDLQILGHRTGKTNFNASLPPPLGVRSSAATPHHRHSQSSKISSPQSFYNNSHFEMDHLAVNNLGDAQICPVCFIKPKELVFGCGHQICYDCGQDMRTCHMCRREIFTRIRLY